MQQKKNQSPQEPKITTIEWGVAWRTLLYLSNILKRSRLEHR
jgi:hypothetical protein